MRTLLIHSPDHDSYMTLDIQSNGFGQSSGTLFNVEWWEEEGSDNRAYFPPQLNVCTNDSLYYRNGELSLNSQWGEPFV